MQRRRSGERRDPPRGRLCLKAPTSARCHSASSPAAHTPPPTKDMIPENGSEALISAALCTCATCTTADSPTASSALVPASSSSSSPPPCFPDSLVMSFITRKSIFGYYSSTLIATSSQSAFFCNLIFPPVSLYKCQFSAQASDLSLAILPWVMCFVKGTTEFPGHLIPPTEEERTNHWPYFITRKTEARGK